MSHKIFGVLPVFILCIGCYQNTPQKDKKALNNAEKIVQKITKANGLDKWDNVQKIKFTFNVDRDTNHFERTWVWMPKDKQVTSIQNNDTITFLIPNLDSTTKPLHKAFINDKFWLLAPFNLVWDEHKTLSLDSTTTSPIANKKLLKLTKVYQNKGGYTPGDAYDFYVDTNYLIKEWTYRKLNESTPSLNTTWENYQVFNGIKLATMHQDKTGGFKLYFSNIEVN